MGARAWVPEERLHVVRAPLGGHLHVLQWAREHGCPWDSWTCTYAAMGRVPGDVEVGAGAPLPVERDSNAYAVACGHLDVLRWTREHGCPWRAATRDAAATKGYSDHLPLSA